MNYAAALEIFNLYDSTTYPIDEEDVENAYRYQIHIELEKIETALRMPKGLLSEIELRWIDAGIGRYFPFHRAKEVLLLHPMSLLELLKTMT